MFLNLQCGMSIFSTLPTMTNQVSEWQRMEKNYWETMNTRTVADAEMSVCNIAIMTREGSNAAREWNEKRRDSHESSAKKKNKSRKERRAYSR